MSGLWLKNLAQFRLIEWHRSWTWDIQFEDPTIPEPFKEWFPATDVDEGIFNIDPYNFNAGFGAYEIPKAWTMLSLSVTFLDTSFLVLEKWFEHWVNEVIFGGGTYVACLDEAVKKINIAKLDNKRDLISLNSYLVFPTGPFNFSGNSASDFVSHQVEFRIAKILSKKRLK